MLYIIGNYTTIGICLLIIHVLLAGKVKKRLLVFASIAECVLILLLVRAFLISNEEIIGVAYLQLIVLMIIKKEMKDKGKNKLYEVAADSVFRVVLITGVTGLQEEEYGKLQDQLIRLIDFPGNFVAHNYLFLSYVDKKLVFRFLFKKKEDYENYINWVPIENFQEIDDFGKGISMIYECAIL